MILLILLSIDCLKEKSSFKSPAESLYYNAIKLSDPLKAVKIYRDIAVKFPDAPQADSAIFRIAMFYYIQEDYSQSAETFQNIIKKGESSPLYEKANYWAWKCYRILGKEKMAKKLKIGSFHNKKISGKFTIQMGAFNEMRWAENMYQRLKILGYDVFIKKGPHHTKVYVGGFNSKDEAKKVLLQLKNKGFDGFITNFPK